MENGQTVHALVHAFGSLLESLGAKVTSIDCGQSYGVIKFGFADRARFMGKGAERWKATRAYATALSNDRFRIFLEPDWDSQRPEKKSGK